MGERSRDPEVPDNNLSIPPPLDFPQPHVSAESSNPSSILSAPQSSSPSTSPERNGLASGPKTEPIKTTAAPIKTPDSRPLLNRKNLSEAPVVPQTRSMLSLRRSRTGDGVTALNSAAYPLQQRDSDSFYLSSSEDDETPQKTHRKSPLLGGGLLRKEKDSHSDKHKTNTGRFSKFWIGNEDFTTKGRVSKTSGRLDISVKETANKGYLARTLGATLHHHLQSIHKPPKDESAKEEPAPPIVPIEEKVSRPILETRVSNVTGIPLAGKTTPKPKLNIVVMVIGSRGDIQPFLKLGKVLKEECGHRVRIATHPAFKKFVEQDSGLEFFSVGGDPAELMAFMVKNPGLIPSLSTVKAGEIGRKRDSMFEMFQGFWRACINARDDETDPANIAMMENQNPFVADAIIANPPSFAHVHCAERLGIPLHIMFTFPYSPTQQFPHPLANIQKTNVDTNYTNFISYSLVEMMTWQGLGDLINRFRVKTLGLEPVSTVWAPGQLFRMKVPYTYLWSPGLIPKPADWGPEIDIAGFVFLDLASSFEPPESLTKFLDEGEPPVYIGFGSIVVDDPDRFTKMIFEAVAKAGVRALVSKGWGGLGDKDYTPDNIYMLENTPHDWLFPRVSAVVHHGGAGTNAIGLKCGKPTMIVPFFGDQPFWGAMVAKAGAGAKEPIPYKSLTADRLAEGIRQCLSPEAKINAQKLAESIAKEGDGAANAVDSFHRQLPLIGKNSMRCSFTQDRVAVWELKKASLLQLSALAAEMLVDKKKLTWKDLRLARHKEWNDFEGPGEPFTGGGLALANSVGGIVMGVGGTPIRWAKSVKRRGTKHERRHLSTSSHPNGEARRSTQSRKSSKPPTEPSSPAQKPQVEPASPEKKPTDEKAPKDGEIGMEELLPDGPPLEQRGRKTLEKMGSLDQGQNGSLPEQFVNVGDMIDDGNEYAISDVSVESDDNLAQEFAVEAGMGLAQTGEALARVPMDLALAVAQGFHNAPRLYGDTTVRTPIRISGFHSGLRAAGEELVFGVYDGVTGLWLQPYHGARSGGALGFVLGIGKGFGGFIFKDLAAIIGPMGYTMKGVHKELVKSKQPTQFIRRARIAQGAKEVQLLDATARRREEDRVEKAWAVVLEILQEMKQVKEGGTWREKARFRAKHRRLQREGKFESVGSAALELEKWRRERARESARKGMT